MFLPYRFRFIYALSAVLLVVVGCADKTPPKPAPKPPVKIKLGFLVKQPENQWFQAEWKFARKCADKYDFELIPMAGMNGPDVMADIDRLASKGVQGFVICAPDVKLGPAIVNKAETRNMRVYTVDDRLLASNGEPMEDIPFMGVANREVGQMAGKAIFDEFTRRKWKPEETGVCVISYDGLASAKDRTDGAVGALKAGGFPQDRIFTAAMGNPNASSATDATDALVAQHKDVKKWLVCSVNDDCVLAAVRAIESARIKAWSIIGVGIGSGVVSVGEFGQAKPSGFFGSVLLEKKRHGYESTEYLYKWVKFKTRPPMETYTKGVLINRGNYKQVLKDQGLM